MRNCRNDGTGFAFPLNVCVISDLVSMIRTDVREMLTSSWAGAPGSSGCFGIDVSSFSSAS